MSKKKPCGLDYCPQEELIGAYASCTACALSTTTGTKWLSSDNPITKFWLMNNIKPFQTVSEWIYNTFGIREY